MLPEELLMQKFEEHDVGAYVRLDDAKNKNSFVLIVRTSDFDEQFDDDGFYVTNNYNFTISCFIKGGILASIEFAEKIKDIIYEFEYSNDIEDFTYGGGGAIPDLNDYSGYSLSIAIALQKNKLIN